MPISLRFFLPCFCCMTLLLLGGLVSPVVAQVDEESAKATIEERGLRVRSSGIVSEREAELRQASKQVAKIRKSLLVATRELAAVQQVSDQIRGQATQLQQQQVGYSAQLANLNPNARNHTTINNKLVGMLNAISGQRELLLGQQGVVDNRLAKSRQVWNEAREDYLQLVLDMRVIVEEVQESYEQHAKDTALLAAVKELNEATGKSYSLAPSRSFSSSIKRLESLEKEVLSESIDLRREGNTLYASVVINGKYKQEMVVDSGASLICLTGRVAKKLGVEPTADDPTITLVMADGRQIEGKRITIDEVRVGKFTVKNVEAAVLGPQAINAEPLLGMSYLGNFKFELDAKAGTLNMVNIEGANPADQKKSPKSKRRRSR